MREDEGLEVAVGRSTQRLDTNELYELIEQSEGAEVARRVFARGTPSGGLPQVVAEPVAEAPARQPSRLHDFLLGGAISLLAMIAWFCATQL